MAESIEEKMKKLADKKQSLLVKERMLREREKQKRAKQFAEIGRLAYSANIDHIDKEALLGAFIEISKKVNEDGNLEKWKKHAGEFLNEKKENDTIPLTISFTEDPSKEAKEKLKEMKFKWNSFRREYYGYGNKKEVENLLNGMQFRIECPELDIV